VDVYEVNEAVMCKKDGSDAYGYLAKVLAVLPDKQGRVGYKIRFQGSGYDKEIEPDQVEEMLFKHRPELEAELKKAAKKEEDEEGDDDEDLMKVIVPEKLLALLVGDKERVSEKGRLVKLPARVTVDDIIKEYGEAVMSRAYGDELLADYLGSRRIERRDLIANKRDNVETSKTIGQYFNILLGSQLLYATEREQ
ncbi:hypothetical protein PFISCL1PPCAC_13532, partial [Pristionchus fissidentatus]